MLKDADWRAKIECGAGGLVGVAWGSDSRHILTMAEWATILTVWSLSSQSVQYVRNPKMWTTQSNTVLHNRNRDYSFIMERRDCRDVLNIFSSDWQLVRQVSLGNLKATSLGKEANDITQNIFNIKFVTKITDSTKHDIGFVTNEMFYKYRFGCNKGCRLKYVYLFILYIA